MIKNYNEQSNKSGVYQIRNIVNGKIYIGSTKCFKVRALQHEKSLNKNTHNNKHLLSSWNKYGSENFIFEILEVIEGTEIERKTIEQKYIDKFLTEWDKCYNISKSTNYNSVFSKTKIEINYNKSEAQKIRWQNLEEKNKQSERMLLMWKDDSLKEKHSYKLKQIWMNKQHKENVSSAQKKFWAKQDISYKDAKIKRMLSNRTNFISEEHKKKIKETAKRKFLESNREASLYVAEEQILIAMHKDKFHTIKNKKVQIKNLITNQIIDCNSISMAARLIITKPASLIPVLKGIREHYKYWTATYIEQQ